MCILRGCAKNAYCRGLCRSHYVRWQRQGKPQPLEEWARSGGHKMHRCDVCGTPHRADRGRRVCSEECAAERQRRRDLEHYRRSERRRRQLLENARRRRREKPEQARAQDARKWARTRADPERLARARAKNREVYRRHADRIQAERRARLDAMNPAERQAWADRARRYCREWRRKHLKDLKRDPEAYARYRQIQNEYHRLYYELRAGPPPERECVVCGEVFAARKFRVLCGKPECLAQYHRDSQARCRARRAAEEFLRIERQLTERLADAET